MFSAPISNWYSFAAEGPLTLNNTLEASVALLLKMKTAFDEDTAPVLNSRGELPGARDNYYATIIRQHTRHPIAHAKFKTY